MSLAKIDHFSNLNSEWIVDSPPHKRGNSLTSGIDLETVLYGISYDHHHTKKSPKGIRASFQPQKDTLLRKDDIKQCEHMIHSISGAFHDGYGPDISGDGSGGTYFLYDERKTRIAVFKPSDEEAFAPNNPRGHVGEMGQPGFRQGIRAGEAAAREVAAYLLDCRTHFCDVPLTLMASMAHPSLSYLHGDMIPKTGSLQSFVSNSEAAGNFAPQTFPVHEVHKIAILDIILVNTDRNEGNILVRKSSSSTSKSSSSLSLIPIDHGYCLPDILEIAWCDWVWLDWPQAKVPFDSECKEFIRKFDVEHFAELLESKIQVRSECLLNMKITTRLLQKCAAVGMNLHQIAKIISRDNLDAPSLLEIIVSQSRALARKSLSKKMKDKVKSSSISHRSMSLRSADFANDSLDYRRMNVRRISFQTLEALGLEDTEEFEEEFWTFLNVLMDDLVDRKMKMFKRVRTSSRQFASVSTMDCVNSSSNLRLVTPLRLSGITEPAFELTNCSNLRREASLTCSDENSSTMNFNTSSDLDSVLGECGIVTRDAEKFLSESY